MEMVLEPLLRERVRFVYFLRSPHVKALHVALWDLSTGVFFVLVQGFGVAEGRHKEDLKNMANAAGQSCRDYTPPGGETLDQVSRDSED